MDVTFGGGSNTLKKATLDFFVQRGSITGHDKMRQPTLNEVVKDKGAVNREVCHIIYAKGLSFNLVNSPYFKDVVEAIANFCKCYTPSFYHEAKVTY